MREPLLTMKDCCHKAKSSAAHLYRLMEKGLWPMPVKLGWSSRWIPDEVDAAIEALANARKPNPQSTEKAP